MSQELLHKPKDFMMNEWNKYENINAWNYLTDAFDFLPLWAIVWEALDLFILLYF